MPGISLVVTVLARGLLAYLSGLEVEIFYLQTPSNCIIHSVPQRNGAGNKFERLLGNISGKLSLREYNWLLLRTCYY